MAVEVSQTIRQKSVTCARGSVIKREQQPLDHLILTPTHLERQILLAETPNFRFELCGFGPIAAAAETARWINSERPKQVILVGIAGSYDLQLAPIASARAFSGVSCHGVGVGDGPNFRTAGDMGFSHIDLPSGGVVDRLPLQNPIDPSGHLELLTVCSASAGKNDVAARRAKFPQAVAEDMEGFSVALACAVRQIPLTIIRGMSNLAGDRNKDHWQIESALLSAVQLFQTLIVGQQDGD